MRNKLVLWGKDAQDDRVLITLELLSEENQVTVRVYEENAVPDPVYRAIMDQWRLDQEVELPPAKQELIRELKVAESLLPDELKADRTDLLLRAQTEWHFTVLSEKLRKAYQAELEEIKDRIERAPDFESEHWNSLRDFWRKVQDQIRDRTILREHTDELKKQTNALFAVLKERRSALDKEFRDQSKESLDKFNDLLADIEERIEKNLPFNNIFKDLRDLQRKFHNEKFTKDHRKKLWNRIDAAFKAVKAKRFGDKKENAAAADRLQKRYDGLLKAIEKMERSIKRDENDLKFEHRRMETTNGQLEAQIRQAKVQMIQSRMDSKQEKLADMHNTRKQLEQRMEKQRKRDEERKQREEEEKRKAEAAAAAKEKIAREMAAAKEEVSEAEKAKLAKAAELLRGEEATESSAAPTEAQPDGSVRQEAEELLEAAGDALGESLTDVVDTVRAIAEVLGKRIGESVQEFRQQVTEEGETAAEPVESAGTETEEEEETAS
jgi:hypothetical protein